MINALLPSSMSEEEQREASRPVQEILGPSEPLISRGPMYAIVDHRQQGLLPGYTKGQKRPPSEPGHKKQIRRLTAHYTKEIVKNLVEIALNGENEMARVAASREILDRAYGRPTPPKEDQDESKPAVTIVINGDDAKL